MIDIVIRDCGYGEWLPIIVETDTKKELFRGSRLPDADLAFMAGKLAWLEGTTGNIKEFKEANGL